MANFEKTGTWVPTTKAKGYRVKWRAWIAPAAVLVLGLILRIGWINHESVSYDESFSILVSQMPFGQMMHALIEDFVHPPLHYLVLRLWLDLFGVGLFQARLLSAICSALSIAVLLELTRCLFDRPTALLASLLLAIAQVAVMFADDSRPYAQMELLTLLATYFFWRALREGRADFWWGFLASAVAMVYTHYYGFFVLAALALFAAIYRQRYRLPLGRAAAGAAILAISYIPWAASGILPAMAHNNKTFGELRTVRGDVHLSTFVTTLNTFNNGKPAGLLNSSPPWTFAAGILLFGLPALLAVPRAFVRSGPFHAVQTGGVAERRARGAISIEQQEREGMAFALLLWLLPLLAVLALGLGLHIQYFVRYVLICLAPYYIVVARGLVVLRPSSIRWTLVALISLYSANALRANYSLRWKEDFGSAWTYVAARQKQGDCAAFFPGAGEPLQWVVASAGQTAPRVVQGEQVHRGAPGCNRIFAISYAPGENIRWWRQSSAERQPLEQGRVELESTRYYGMRVDLYAAKTRTSD